jgi:hypothetical protein
MRKLRFREIKVLVQGHIVRVRKKAELSLEPS